MKDKYIICIIVIVLICLLIWAFIDSKPRIISNIKHFHFSYSVGNYMNGSYLYEIDCDDKCIVTIKYDGESEEDAFKGEISEDKKIELEVILNKYDVGKWDGFSKADKNVLDGNSFSLNINSDIYVSASGYMKYPKNYREVKSELDSYFKNIREGK